MKFTLTANNLRNIAYNHSSKDYNVVWETKEANKKLKSKYLLTSLDISGNLAKIIKINKVQIEYFIIL
jgi:hypothetical protein